MALLLFIAKLIFTGSSQEKRQDDQDHKKRTGQYSNPLEIFDHIRVIRIEVPIRKSATANTTLCGLGC